jgi:hypothetical protein
MAPGNAHTSVAEAGEDGFEQSVDLFCPALLTRRDEQILADPAAIVTAFLPGPGGPSAGD